MQTHSAKEINFCVLAFLFSLFTLVTCAFPVILITIGMEEVVIEWSRQYPVLLKIIEFGETLLVMNIGILMLPVALFRKHNKEISQRDPAEQLLFKKARKIPYLIFALSALIWFVGFFISFYFPLFFLLWSGQY